MRVPAQVWAGLVWGIWVVASAATGSRAAGVVVALLALAGMTADGLLAINIRCGEMKLRRTLERLDCRRRERLPVAWSWWDGQSSLLIDGRVFMVVKTDRANTPLVDAEGDGG